MQEIKLKSVIVQYFISLLTSAIGLAVFYGAYLFFENIGLQINSWGDRSGLIFIIIGFPTGSVLGILIFDKIMYKSSIWNLESLFFAFLSGLFLGNLISFLIYKSIHAETWIIFIFIFSTTVSLVSIIVYNLTKYFVNNSKCGGPK